MSTVATVDSGIGSKPTDWQAGGSILTTIVILLTPLGQVDRSKQNTPWVLSKKEEIWEEECNYFFKNCLTILSSSPFTCCNNYQSNSNITYLALFTFSPFSFFHFQTEIFSANLLIRKLSKIKNFKYFHAFTCIGNCICDRLTLKKFQKVYINVVNCKIIQLNPISNT